MLEPLWESIVKKFLVPYVKYDNLTQYKDHYLNSRNFESFLDD